MRDAHPRLARDNGISAPSGRPIRSARPGAALPLGLFVDKLEPRNGACDEETPAAAREIIEEERAMAKVIEQNWDRFAELSLQEEGITV